MQTLDSNCLISYTGGGEAAANRVYAYVWIHFGNGLGLFNKLRISKCSYAKVLK